SDKKGVALLDKAVPIVPKIDPKNQQEIALLDKALASFLEEYNIPWVPSKLELNPCPEGSPSARFMSMLFPRHDVRGKYTWNGKDAESVTLEGQHVLVFLLGGIASAEDPPQCQGFSANPSNPAETRQKNAQRRAPLFDFSPKRLKRDTNGFLVYLDVYG